MKTLTLLTLITAFSVGSLLAQDKEERTSTRVFSLRGKPLPECRYFAITEFGLFHRIPARENEGSFYVMGELGVMRNINRKSSAGATFVVGGTEFGGRLGIKPRYRYWMNPNTSLDIAPGILLGGFENTSGETFPGFSGHLGLNFRQLDLSLIGQLEIISRDKSFYAGAKLGGYAGPIAAVIVLIFAAIAVSSISGP